MKNRNAFFVALALTIVWAGTSVAQQTAEDLFQAGLYQEEVQGDLERAVEIYQTILNDHANNRAVAAKAQLHIGICYETLGLQEAQRAYERVVANYGDQSEVVSQARARLAVLRAVATAAAPTGPVARRLLEDDGCSIEFMRPSPNGTHVAYVESCGTLAVFLRDLASGEIEQITRQGMHVGVAWSSDGRRLATAEVYPRQQLKLIDLETGAIEEPAHMAGLIFTPDDWSPDGDYLAGRLQDAERKRSTMVVSLRTGERIPLAAQVARSTPRTAFSPDGRYVAFTDFSQNNWDIYVLALETRERHRVTTALEVDEGAVWSPDGSTIIYHNPLGSWAIRVVDGRAAGEPWLVRSEPFGASSGRNTWTANGYYYPSNKGVVRPYRITVDPETAQALSSPELIDAPIPMIWGAPFAWSPDMECIASSGGEDRGNIHVTRGQSVTSFKTGDETRVSDLWWSADGSEILYNTRTSGRRDQRTTVFALRPADGRVRELFPPTEEAHSVHVSPDGTRMVYLKPVQTVPDSAPTLAGELVVSDLGDFEGGRVLAPSSITDGRLAMQYRQPQFSPNGKQVLYLGIRWFAGANELPGMSLWVVAADGSAPARRLATSVRIDGARWDPTGRWIVYHEYQGSGQNDARGVLSVVSVETGARHQILTWGGDTTPGELLLHTGLKDWSPDGRWIGITQGARSFEYWVVDDPLGEPVGQGR